jgi:hypothetical protein
MVMIQKFLKAVSREWVSLITGIASVPLTLFAFWVSTPLQRTAWAILATTCFVLATYRIWAFEYRRAEEAEEKLKSARPWVAIEGYSSGTGEDEETGEEYTWETVHIVNRGKTPAVSIVIPTIQSSGQTARLSRPLPALGPGEGIDAPIMNLRSTLRRGLDKLPSPPKGSPKSILLPLVIEYRGLDHSRWTTEQTISFSFPRGIGFAITHPDEPQQWTSLSASE